MKTKKELKRRNIVTLLLICPLKDFCPSLIFTMHCEGYLNALLISLAISIFQ